MRFTFGRTPDRRGGGLAGKATRGLIALQLAAAPLAWAQGGVERLFPAQPAGFVTDAAGALDAGSVAAMTAKIERLRGATGAEIAVVTLPTIGDYAAVDVAVAIGRAWGVGAQAAVGDERRNTGLVILLVPRREDDPTSGQIFIATGQGLEGFVTDAAAGRVRDLMRPDLSAGNYGAGLSRGVDALSAMIARGMGVTDSVLAAGGRAIERRGTVPIGMIILALFVVLVMVSIIASAARSAAHQGPRGRRRGRRGPDIFMGGPGFGGGFGGFGGGMGGGGFGGFGGGGGFSGGGAGGRF